MTAELAVCGVSLTSVNVVLFPRGKWRARAIFHVLLRGIESCGRTDLLVENRLMALEWKILCVLVDRL